MNDTLKNKLLNSDAVKSIQQEIQIYDVFKKLNWKVLHSPYFTDPNSGKMREVDITANKYWQKKPLQPYFIEIEFVVECKSINGYHIVASNNCEDILGGNMHSNWIGNDGFNQFEKLRSICSQNGIKDDITNRIVNRLESFCFPDGIPRFFRYGPNTFKLDTFSSFRETNIGKTKDIDNSVVWKAFQSLNSYVNAKETDNWNGIDHLLKEFSFKQNSTPKSTDLDDLIENLKARAMDIDLTHPVLVLDSDLWELNKGILTKIPYMRLAFEHISNSHSWIDLVSFKYLNDYFEKSKQYDESFISNGFNEITEF